MKIKTWEIDKLKNGLELNYEEDLSHLVKEYKQFSDISPVKVIAIANKQANVYTIKGQVTADLKLQCSRCLTYYNYQLTNDFDEMFIQDEIEMNWDKEDNDVSLLKSDEIDMTAIIEEAVVLAIPYIPICHEDCQGLCHVCGINLNEHSCDCKTDKIDPRLAELAKLFDQNNKTE